MKNIKHLFSFIFYFSLLVIVTACGTENIAGIEGTGGTGGGTVARPITSVGSIDGFGSVIVNGVKFETDNTVFTIDNDLGRQDDLSVGQIVIVSGTINDDKQTGTANEVLFSTNVIGLIETINQLEASFTVLGQTVFVNSVTEIEGAQSFSELEVGQEVQISGYINSAGDIFATWINAQSMADSYELVGVIEALDTNAQTFLLNEMVVHYDSATISGGASLANNQTVKVTATQLDDEGALIAATITIVELELGPTGNLIQVEGLVNAFNSSESFQVNSIPVITDDNTDYVNGVAADVNLDARVEVEGVLNDQDQIVAERIIIIHTEPVVLRGVGQSDGPVNFTIESSENDDALWLRISGFEGKMLVAANREPSLPLEENECWVYFNTTESICYLENTGATTWNISVFTDENETFSISAFLARVPTNSVRDIEVRESIAETAISGDRYLYRLPAGPSGSILEVQASQLSSGITISINDDQASTNNRYDCRLVSGEQEFCRLNNDGVDYWHILVEAAASGNFALAAKYINPAELQSTETGFFNEEGYAVYTLSAAADVYSVAAHLQTSGSSARVELSVNKPMMDKEWLCSDIPGLTEAQCILANPFFGESESLWYVTLYGESGSTYTLDTILQTSNPQQSPLNPGETIPVNTQAGEILKYTISAVEPDRLFKINIVNQTPDTYLELTVSPQSNLQVKFCPGTYIAGELARLCETNRQSQDDYIVEIKSSQAVTFDLTVETFPFTAIDNLTPLSGAITDSTGIYYRFSPEDNQGSQIQFELSNITAPVDMSVSKGLDASDQCNSQEPGQMDESCSLIYYSLLPYYIWIEGDIGASYDLQVTLLD